MAANSPIPPTLDDDFDDFDADTFFASLYPSVGVGGVSPSTAAFDALYPPSTSSGVGHAASPPFVPAVTPPSPSPPPRTSSPVPPVTRLAAVGVGGLPISLGKVPRQTFGDGGNRRLPPPSNPHRRSSSSSSSSRSVSSSQRGRRQRRRSLLSSSATGGKSSGGGGGSSDDDDDDDDRQSNASSVSNPGGRHRMSQEEFRRQLEMLSNDQVQTASGRRIAGITTTNTITTTYKDGGRPRVARHSSRVSH